MIFSLLRSESAVPTDVSINRFGLSRRLALALIPLAAVLSGCGEARVPVYPVSGVVKFNGKAPTGAQIVLHPAGNSEPTEVTPVGIVQSDGTFKVTAYDPGDGAPVGEYVATVEWFKVVSDPGGGGGPGPNVLPKKYASSKTSPIKVSVGDGPTEIEPIVIANN